MKKLCSGLLTIIMLTLILPVGGVSAADRVVASNFKLSNDEAFPVTKADLYDIEIMVANISSDEIALIVTFVAYKDGRVTSIATSDSMVFGGSRLYKTRINLMPENTIVKAFVWDNAENISPLCVKSKLQPYAHKFPGGDGTKENPYQVSTPEDLNAVRYYLSAHFLQINDIDMTEYTAEGGKYYNGGAGW